MATEQQKFLEELKGNEGVDILTKPLEGAEAQGQQPEKEVDPEQVEENLKNRRHKRLEAKLQAEREANIALNAKLAALSEVEKFKREEPDADLHSVLYGTAAPTEETRAVAERLQKILQSNREKAKEEALSAVEERLAKESEAQKAEENELDSIREHLEDDYSANLSEDQWRGYFALMEKMSPKKDGEVIAYADPDAVWEEYQAKLQVPKDNRAKNLASRSMVQSGASGDTKIQRSAEENWLKENGII